MTTALVNQNVSLVSPEPVQCPSEKKNKKIKVPEVPCMTRMFLKGEPLALGIKSAVALNIISALLAMSGICYFCFAFTVQHDLESCVVSDGSFYMRYSDCEYRAEILKGKCSSHEAAPFWTLIDNSYGFIFTA
ncbi:hypothetical protein QTP86_030263 [Hemibagrus guttatus]|nr:hypothetical protein QTP86_030263 [Hemibagrus guttatus]